MNRANQFVLWLRALRSEAARWRLALERARWASKSEDEEQELRVPHLKHPLWLRAGGSDYFTFLQIFLAREYEHGFALEPKLIVDAGANIGLASIFLANAYPEADILAIEPQGKNFSLLQRNTAAYPNVRCLRGALWPEVAKVAIVDEISCGNPAAFQVRELLDGTPTTLACFTPLSLLELSGRASIDVFKIDIEGAELELFSRGSESWLHRVGLIMVEIHDAARPGCGEAFFRSICNRHFEYRQRSETTIVRFLDGAAPK